MLDLSRFDYDTYRALLTLLEEHHDNTSYVDVKGGLSGDRWYIMRHDIDYSPESALRMAEIEKEVGVRSVYFLLFNSPWYNLLSPEYINFPKALVELGHEVGLHYDGAVFESQAKVGNASFLIESYAEILSSMSGRPIECASMHNPSLYSGQDLVALQGRFISAYDSFFTQKTTYISDSLGAWRDNAHDILTNGPLPETLQVLVHPVFWEEQHVGRLECMEKALCNGGLIAHRWKDIHAAHCLRHEGVLQHDRRCGKRSNSRPWV